MPAARYFPPTESTQRSLGRFDAPQTPGDSSSAGGLYARCISVNTSQQVRTTRITGGLLSPYKGLLPASLLRGTEIYSTCITCPTARKRAICCSNESIPIIGRLMLPARFARCLKLKLFYGAPPPAEPVVSVNNKEKAGSARFFYCPVVMCFPGRWAPGSKAALMPLR